MMYVLAVYKINIIIYVLKYIDQQQEKKKLYIPGPGAYYNIKYSSVPHDNGRNAPEWK